MPKLMEKQDWIRTVANVGSADRVWFENVRGRRGSLSFSVPESGTYQVILVKLDGNVSPVAARQRTKRPATLFETLRSCPFGGVELDIKRDRGLGREVAFT